MKWKLYLTNSISDLYVNHLILIFRNEVQIHILKMNLSKNPFFMSKIRYILLFFKLIFQNSESKLNLKILKLIVTNCKTSLKIVKNDVSSSQNLKLKFSNFSFFPSFSFDFSIFLISKKSPC